MTYPVIPAGQLASGPISPYATFIDYINALAVDVDTNTGAIAAVLPSQTGAAGKYLTSNGAVTSWATVPVTSVNGNTGAVTLTYSSVGAASTTDPRLSDTRTPTFASLAKYGRG